MLLARPIAFALFSFLLAGCGDSPVEPSFDVEGSWVAYSVNGNALPELVAPNPDPDCEGIFLLAMEVDFTETAVEMREDREDWCSPLHVSIPTTRTGLWQVQGGAVLVWSPPNQGIEDAGKFMIRGDELEWMFNYDVGGGTSILSVVRLRRVAGGPEAAGSAIAASDAEVIPTFP